MGEPWLEEQALSALSLHGGFGLCWSTEELQLMLFPFMSRSQLAKALLVIVHLPEKAHSTNWMTFQGPLGSLGLRHLWKADLQVQYAVDIQYMSPERWLLFVSVCTGCDTFQPYSFRAFHRLIWCFVAFMMSRREDIGWDVPVFSVGLCLVFDVFHWSVFSS